MINIRKQFLNKVLFDEQYQTISLNKKMCYNWEQACEETLAKS